MLARTVEAVLRRQLPRSLGTMTRTISTKEQAPEEPKEGADRNSVLLLTFADLPSAAPAGTVFTGLSIFKDKPDPVARPDHEYPSWLFELLDDPAFRSRKTVMVGDVDTTGMSKGEARSALKRAAKVARSAVRKQQAAEAKAAAQQQSMSEEQRAASARAAEAEAEAALPKTPSEFFVHELAQRRAMRKNSRSSIKASNFVRAA